MTIGIASQWSPSTSEIPARDQVFAVAMPCASGSPLPRRERGRMRVIEVATKAFPVANPHFGLLPFSEGRGDKKHAIIPTLFHAALANRLQSPTVTLWQRIVITCSVRTNRNWQDWGC